MTEQPVSEHPIRVVRNIEQERFEAWLGSDLAGIAEFLPGPEALTFTHTKVFPEFEGKGVGNRLAEAALAEVRERGEKVIAQCPFIRRYIEEHAEYQELLAAP